MGRRTGKGRFLTNCVFLCAAFDYSCGTGVTTVTWGDTES